MEPWMALMGTYLGNTSTTIKRRPREEEKEKMKNGRIRNSQRSDKYAGAVVRQREGS